MLTFYSLDRYVHAQIKLFFALYSYCDGLAQLVLRGTIGKEASSSTYEKFIIMIFSFMQF